jgi:hypothetical protein
MRTDHLFVEHAITTGCRQPFFQINTEGITVCLITVVCCNINNPTSSKLEVMCYLTSEENDSEVAHI